MQQLRRRRTVWLAGLILGAVAVIGCSGTTSSSVKASPGSSVDAASTASIRFCDLERAHQDLGSELDNYKSQSAEEAKAAFDNARGLYNELKAAAPTEIQQAEATIDDDFVAVLDAIEANSFHGLPADSPVSAEFNGAKMQAAGVQVLHYLQSVCGIDPTASS